MQAITFETEAHGGIVKIPAAYSAWFEKPVKVILLAEELPALAIKPRIPGLGRSTIKMREDFDAPLPDSFWLGES